MRAYTLAFVLVVLFLLLTVGLTPVQAQDQHITFTCSSDGHDLTCSRVPRVGDVLLVNYTNANCSVLLRVTRRRITADFFLLVGEVLGFSGTGCHDVGITRVGQGVAYRVIITP